MKNSYLTARLIDTLTHHESIVFALLFGSQYSGNSRFDSDIDIAIWFEDVPDILVLGGIVAELESATQGKVDLIVLNDLHTRNPLLAYNITGGHDILINRNRNSYEGFKHRSYINYFDFEPVIRAQNQKLIEELNHGNFGKAKRA